MNIKKILKEDSENVDKQISQEGQKLYKTLSQKYCVQSNGTAVVHKKSSRSALIITIACVFVCLLTAGILWISLSHRETEYRKDDERTADITIESIYKETGNKVNINTNAYNIVATNKVYDSVSQDYLYFSVKIKDTNNLVNGNISLVANAKYSFSETYPAEPTETVWNNITVKYAIASHSIDAITTNNVFGYFEYNKLKIYFSYEQMDLGQAATPIQFLEDALILN